MPLIVDGNKEIITPIENIVEILREHVFALGINKLEKIEKKGNNLRITCPVHKGGCESRPSCDVLLEDKVVGKKIVPAGTVHCFSCGYSASFVKNTLTLHTICSLWAKMNGERQTTIV